ncbi:hypothetical protein EAE96_000049 [Botrytis aclada]|nr:hypothetical protein EAE96_000049 [Botrytis aclada]
MKDDRSSPSVVTKPEFKTMNGVTKAQSTKSRRSVANMNETALAKKRENDRNAQRNIREKARKEKTEMEQKIQKLESQQRRFDELLKRNEKLRALLLKHDIDPDTEEVLSPRQTQPLENIAPEKRSLGSSQGFPSEGMLEGMEMDRSTTGYQFPIVSQPNLQQAPGLLPIYNQMESNQLLNSPELIGSPASLYSHHSASRTGSPQNTGAVSPPYPSHQSMTPLQHMSQPMYPLSMPIQSMGSIPQMSPPHDISLQQNSGYQNTYTQDWTFPGSAGPIWDQTVAFRPMSTYAVPMTMEKKDSLTVQNVHSQETHSEGRR